MNPEEIMRIALEEAKKGDNPYGAAIAKDNRIVAKAHNTVRRDKDPSAHAEINAIRQLTHQLDTPSLAGYVLYSTAEPCPMCATACIWAGISEIICGVSIRDLIEAGVSQIDLPCEAIIAQSFRTISVAKGVLKPECLKLFQ